MTEESKMLVDRCKLVAEAYTNQNAELSIGTLAEDSVYESQSVIEPLKGKNAIAHYIMKSIRQRMGK